MPTIARNWAASLVMLIIALFLIWWGALLTLSIIFIFIGIPMLIIGITLLIASIISFFTGTLSGLFYLLSRIFRVRSKPKKKRKDKKVIDVHKEGDVYKAS